jgi:hypothetical protein
MSGHPTPSNRSNRLLVAACLGASVVLNVHTWLKARTSDPVEVAKSVSPLSAPELAVVQRSVVGHYTTGDGTGDRSITVRPGGEIEFAEQGSANPLLNNRDTYTLGRSDNRRCLATRASGVIEIFDSDTLLYFGDSYRRR